MNITKEQEAIMVNTMFEKSAQRNEAYASKRKFAHKAKGKKVTLETLAREVSVARVLGETGGAETILRAIVDNKDWTREDIEAEIHLFIESLAQISSMYLHGKKMIGLEDILEKYDYYAKKEPTCQ